MDNSTTPDDQPIPDDVRHAVITSEQGGRLQRGHADNFAITYELIRAIQNLPTVSAEEVAEYLAVFGDIATAHMRKVRHAGHLLTAKQQYSAILNTLNTLGQITNLSSHLLAIQGIKAKKITRRQASQELGVHENTIYRWVNDEKIREAKERELYEFILDYIAEARGMSKNELKRQIIAWGKQGGAFKQGSGGPAASISELLDQLND
ncbi:hypothetical protein GCM10023321_37670 [Pseudonocardia eucalypti]|uniref:Helix-turn-helix domain-containing protein n=1 Tax=Pseudonocardia eucalypti TaxID=648755 RepID=A0ABP9Q826_9PSEU|nr:hypothetical protein [Pseudonocardia eucalypti]